MGRPTSYDHDVAEKLLTRLEDGETLASICRDEDMPGRTTVYDWKDADEGSEPADDRFPERFARARLLGYEKWFEECHTIADDGSNDYVERTRQDGSKFVALDQEHVQRSKLRIETRLKLLARVDPKRYGDRQQHAMTDPDGNGLKMAPMLFVGVEPLTEDER